MHHSINSFNGRWLVSSWCWTLSLTRPSPSASSCPWQPESGRWQSLRHDRSCTDLASVRWRPSKRSSWGQWWQRCRRLAACWRRRQGTCQQIILKVPSEDKLDKITKDRMSFKIIVDRNYSFLNCYCWKRLIRSNKELEGQRSKTVLLLEMRNVTPYNIIKP